MELKENTKHTSRDSLAENRTLLANERTFLAYLRTALSVIVAGLAFMKFFEIYHYIIIGRLLILLGVSIFFIGIHRFLVNKKSIRILTR